MDKRFPMNPGPKGRDTLLKKYLSAWQSHNFMEINYSPWDKTNFEAACFRWVGGAVLLTCDLKQKTNWLVVKDINLKRKVGHCFGCMLVYTKEDYEKYHEFGGYLNSYGKWVLISEIVFPGGF